MSSYCDDCGCKVYNGACTNCHEEIYIEEQYHELGIQLPDQDTEFMKRLSSHHQVIANKGNQDEQS